jgi:hypothetical protein
MSTYYSSKSSSMGSSKVAPFSSNAKTRDCRWGTENSSFLTGGVVARETFASIISVLNFSSKDWRSPSPRAAANGTGTEFLIPLITNLGMFSSSSRSKSKESGKPCARRYSRTVTMRWRYGCKT